MGVRLKTIFYRWWYSYQLTLLKSLDEHTLDLWIKALERLATRTIDIDPTLRLELPHQKLGGYLRDLDKLSLVFAQPIDMPPARPKEMLLEDWLVDRDNYPISINAALTETVLSLKRIRSAFTNTEDCDFAHSVMVQYSELFSTVRLLATVSTRYIIG